MGKGNNCSVTVLRGLFLNTVFRNFVRVRKKYESTTDTQKLTLNPKFLSKLGIFLNKEQLFKTVKFLL